MNVTDDDELVWPLTIRKLDSDDVYGPAITSTTSEECSPDLKSSTSCVVTLYDTRKFSPASTFEGADSCMLCAMHAEARNISINSI